MEHKIVLPEFDAPIIVIIFLELNNKNKLINNSKKIITIIGASNSGKTIFSSLISKIIKNKKILLIDFDFLNNNISTIFGVNKLPQKNNNKINVTNNIKKLIIKINNKLHLICGLETIFNEEQINKNKIKEVLDELKKEYDFIIIDTNTEDYKNNLKIILEESTECIMLVEPNLIGIKNTKKILEKYINKWKINKEKIFIIFNKINKYSISENLLNKLFIDFNILGKIKNNIKHNLIINNNIKIINKKIKKEYLKIINKIN